MDYLEKGKTLAKNGQYEEALESLALALENDKENPDIHFYIGLCYSSLEQFEYAKFHYQLAQVLDPNHEKTRLVWDGLSHVEPKKPPELHLVRKATAHERRAKETDTPLKVEKNFETDSYPTSDAYTSKPNQITDETWEKAFPTAKLEIDTRVPWWQKLFVFILLATILGSIGYIMYQILFPIN